jgi:hypothetical protein
MYSGEVLLGSASEVSESAIIRIVECDAPQLLKLNGEPIPQISVELPEDVVKRYQELILSNIKSCPCGKIVADMDSLHRVDLFTRLVISRLERKCGVVDNTFDRSYMNWSQTMYSMLFRAMGDHKNQDAFQTLAATVPYTALSRERYNGNNVEILLIGASGLLNRYEGDSHTRQIKGDFEYLARKYNITAMMGGEWTLSGINPNNHPIVRISQLAAYFSNTDFIFDKLRGCRTAEDIHALLGSGAGRVSEYWEGHSIPGNRTPRKSKTIGHDKINVLGINFAVPLIFAYGRRLQNEDIKEQALDLLESLEVENNSVTKHWSGHGVVLKSAFDSQAVIELENSFCKGHECWHCPIGRREIKNALNMGVIQKK